MHRSLNILGSVVALLALAVLAVLAMGARLPETHTVSASIVIAAPQGKVWSLLEDLGAQPSWRAGLEGIEPLSDTTVIAAGLRTRAECTCRCAKK